MPEAARVSFSSTSRGGRCRRAMGCASSSPTGSGASRPAKSQSGQKASPRLVVLVCWRQLVSVCASQSLAGPIGPDGEGEQAGKRRMSYTAQETGSSKHFDVPFPPDVVGFYSNHGITPSGACAALPPPPIHAMLEMPPPPILKLRSFRIELRED